MGKLFKANRLDEALKELKAVKGVTESLVDGINTAVKQSDKRHYHVIVVKRANNPLKEEYEVSAFVQMYDQKGFDNLKTRVKGMPFSKIIILHNPTLEKDMEEVKQLTSFQELQVREKVTKELEAKHKKEKEDMAKKIREEILAEQNQKDDNPFGDFDVLKATLPNMQNFAKTNDIDLGEAKELEAVRQVLIEWGRTQ